MTANFKPGMQDNGGRLRHNDARAPLLFISGGEDHLMPPAIQRSNAKHYKSDTITEVKEFEGPHLLPARTGWEEIADYALDVARCTTPGGRVRREPGAVGPRPADAAICR